MKRSRLFSGCWSLSLSLSLSLCFVLRGIRSRRLAFMTSASELFYKRRSRLWRNSDPEFASSSSSAASPTSSPFHRHHRHRHSHNHDTDDCNPSRRTYQARQLFHRDRDSFWNEDPTLFSHTSTGNDSGTSGNGSYWARVDMSERLPGAVLQARARLLERLRGTSVAGSRCICVAYILWVCLKEINHVQNRSGNNFPRMTLDDLRFVDAGDWETESLREWLSSMNLDASSRSLADSSPFSRETKQKPPGLCRDLINNLHSEVFTAREGVPVDCSICLERFMVGDGLIRLPCGHRFHRLCLDPWITNCGDCPYCRRHIEVDSG